MPTIANLDSGSFTEWAGFLGEIPVFADAQGYIRFVEGSQKRLDVHEGLLCATESRDGASLISGGEDGKICATNADGTYNLVHEADSKWIDKIATGPQGAIAFGSGRRGGVILGNGKIRDVEVERSIEGLAFAPKGMRLAIARYDGVELQWINTDGQKQFLEWKGAHTGVMFSNDGKYVVSIMQENALHGWRLIDTKHMRMSGYPTKVASTSFSHRGKWLATSGAPAAILWPFSGKDGPMGKTPKELGGMGKTLVTQVSCHPSADLLAIGYENGMIMAVRIDDGKIVSLRREGKAAISSFGWDRQGGRLAFGSEEGEAGVIDLSE
jgi:WD40 repeat protein